MLFCQMQFLRQPWPIVQGLAELLPQKLPVFNTLLGSEVPEKVPLTFLSKVNVIEKPYS